LSILDHFSIIFLGSAHPWRLTETPASIRTPGPLLGEDTDKILQDYLGMASEEIKKLKEEQVIY